MREMRETRGREKESESTIVDVVFTTAERPPLTRPVVMCGMIFVGGLFYSVCFVSAIYRIMAVMLEVRSR